jgi:hypothetical protein
MAIFVKSRGKSKHHFSKYKAKMVASFWFRVLSAQNKELVTGNWLPNALTLFVYIHGKANNTQGHPRLWTRPNGQAPIYI